MASYGKHEYWEQRYKRDNGSCEWIASWDILERLLKSNFLSCGSAPSPGGEIRVQNLSHYLTAPHLGPLLGINDNRAECVIDEELEYCEPDTRVRTVEFPSRENARVLNVGCGNSRLSADMLYHGWTDIVNVDYSAVVIEQMKTKYADEFYTDLQSCIERDYMLRYSLGLESRDDYSQTNTSHAPLMIFEHGDITKGIQHLDESFDLIICKKTLDVVLCSAGSIADARKMMTECFRLLNKAHGVMILLSSAKPEDRAVYFENDPWTGVLNVKLPCHENAEHVQRKSHDRKKMERYAYILYKHSALNEHTSN